MNLADLKGFALVRLANLEQSHVEQTKMVTLLERDLISARRAADTTDGAIQATKHALNDIERGLAPATPQPVK